VQAVSLIPILTGLTYLAAGLCLALGFFHAREGLRRLAIALAVLALLGHAVTLWTGMVTPAGWDVNFIHTLSLASMMVVVVLLLTSIRSPMLETGIIALPGAALCVWLQWLTEPAALILAQASVTLEVHIFSSLLAYSLLSIAAITAILLAIQDYLLRHPRTIRQLELLPPLTVLETLMFRLILSGWLVLSLSLLTGLMFVDDLLAQHLVHKTVLSSTSWLLFGLLLIGRWWLGWRGRRAIHWTLIAMFVLGLGYFGSKLVLEVVLDRTWTTPSAATTTPDV
jgi:ABC-type uncharacterized transport system permease subunit